MFHPHSPVGPWDAIVAAAVTIVILTLVLVSLFAAT
jgi:hypothetical protein